MFNVSMHCRLYRYSLSVTLMVLSVIGMGESTTVWAKGLAACAYKDIDVEKYGHQIFQNPPTITAADGTLTTTLTVRFTDPKQVNIAGCPVMLRTYNGQLTGPTLRIKPGDTMNILLDNTLPKETPEEIEKQFEQEAQSAWLATRPGSFNTTNLHTHGLHVSPVGNSDNVLLAITPGSTLPYEIKVPRNHEPGSFWYHAHTHGSTSIQVGSGMAGALIIEDDENKIPPALREANKREKVMVFQTILYNTHGQLENISALFPGSDCSGESQDAWTWDCSKRRITINGQIVPIIQMRPGEVQRWRMIDTAFRESINVMVDGHALHEIALDGLYLGRIDTWKSGLAIPLQPGYRSDVLIQGSMKKGDYYLRDGASSADASLRGVAESEHVLAIVRIEGDPVDMKLPTSQEMAALAAYPGVDLTQPATKQTNGVREVQQVDFKLGQDVAGQKNYFQVNYRAFSAKHVRQVKLNAVDMWAITTVGDPRGVPDGIPAAPHVFHIHVNPFQMYRIGPDGTSELVWKDTVVITPVPPNQPGQPAQPVQTVNLYTRYTDYIGKFVMHCHILDHEDLGMMEVIEVVPERGGVADSDPH